MRGGESPTSVSKSGFQDPGEKEGRVGSICYYLRYCNTFLAFLLFFLFSLLFFLVVVELKFDEELNEWMERNATTH